MGNTCKPMAVSFQCMTKSTTNKQTNQKLNIQKRRIMASSPITLWQIDGETMEMVRDFIFLGSKITADGDCSNEIKRRLLLEEKLLPTPFSSVQSLSHVRLFATPWIAARQASWSITNSQRPPKPMSTELVMPYNHLTLCRPLLLLPLIFPSIRVFSNESALCIRWPNYWSFSFSISPSNEYSGLISSRVDWFDLHAHKGLSKVFSSTTIQKHQFFSPQPSLWSNYHIRTWLLEKP